MSRKFNYYNDQTGEYIETAFDHLNLPDNLDTPVLDGIERTMNLGITRAPGWHYADGGMLFIPSYRKVSGQTLSFKISFQNVKGRANREGLVFEFSKSRSFKSKIALADILNVAYGIADADQIKSLVGANSEYLTRKYLHDKESDVLMRAIKHDKMPANDDLMQRLKILVTERTVIESPERVYDLLSLNHFIGTSLAEDVDIGSGVAYAKFSVLDEQMAFNIEHSGLESISLLTETHSRLDVSILGGLYVKLSPGEVSIGDMRKFREAEEAGNQFAFGGKVYFKSGVPEHNTLELYTAIINRLFAFNTAEINFSMQDYKNQRIVTFKDEIEDFVREDLENVHNRILHTSNLLVGVSGWNFDKTRAERLIKNADSAMAVITKNENPLAKTSQGNVLVRDVEYLAQEAIQVLPQDLGIIDPVDSTESKNIGKATPLTMTTVVTPNEPLKTPLYKVIDGVITEEVELVNVGDLPELFVAQEGITLEGNVLAKHRGEVKLFPHNKVTHVRVSPFSSTSACRASSVFMENTDQKRTQMNANAQKQARTILRPKRARIETGIESITANGGTGFKHKFTAREIFKEYDADLPELDGHEFNIDEISNTGMSKEYRLSSTTSPELFAVFQVNTEKSAAGSSYFYELVAPSTYKDVYKPDDIVYKQHNIILGGTVEGSDRLDYHTNKEPDYFDTSLANGLDLFVMFGFSESFTVDDASVISDKVVRDMSLSTPVMVVKKFKKDKIFNKDIEEHFGSSNGVLPEGYSSKGVPLVGTYLRAGAKWLYRYEETTLDGNITDKTLRLSHSEHGEVIAVEDTKEEIRVTLSKWVHVEVGDKFSGRQGNKTIISKVMPQEMMPYHPETGRHVDMIINPLGIPSRGNISQLAELQATAQVEADGLETRVIPPFSNELHQMVKDYDKGKDLTELQLLNPQTGMYYVNKHFCGYMHYLRNIKIAEEQLSAIGDSSELDVGFLQPVGSAELKQKGQSISSMEKEILVSYGATGILDEIHSVLSADRNGFRHVVEFFDANSDVGSVDYKGKNHHAEHMQHAALSFHTTLRQDGDKIHLTYMSDKDMENFSEVDPRQVEFSLTDREFLNTMMYIILPRRMVTPVAVRKFKFASIVPITRINFSGDSSPSSLGEKAIEDIIDGTHFFALRGVEGEAPSIIVYPATLADSVKGDLRLDLLDAYTGMDDLIWFFDSYPLEMWIEHYENNNGEFTNTHGVFQENKVSILEKAKSYIEDGGFQKFVTTRFPVLPNKYRQAKNEINDGDSLSAAYRDITRLAQDTEHNKGAMPRLYNRMSELLLPSQTGSRRLSLFEFWAKKDAGGRIRGKIMKTRVLCSMRSTIVPTYSVNPEKYGYPDYAGEPDSIGLPLIGALRIAQPRLLAYVKRKHADVIEDSQTEIDAMSKIIDILTLPYDSVEEITGWHASEVPSRVKSLKAELIDFVNGSYVFYGRAPSLQETSMRGGRVYVHEEKVIHLHSLLTTDLNADHDGDQIYVVMPTTTAAVEDIKTKLLPSTNALRYNDGVPSLMISQDALLGLYFATEDATEDKVTPVSSLEQLKYFIELQMIKLNDIVQLNINNEIQVKTTAGRLVVHDIIYTSLPETFVKKEDGTYGVKYELPITGDGKLGIDIGELQLQIAQYFNDSKLITDIYSNLQKFGYQAVELRNLTVGIKDLTPVLEVESINDEVKQYVETARTLEELGLLPEDYLVALDNKVNELISKVDIMSKVPKDNAFRILAESGAKGKIGGIEKMFGVMGFVDGNNGEKLSTPVLSNTVKGLSQFQVEDLSYTQRDNAISTVFETSKPGETLRSGAFTLSGMIIQDSQEEFIEQLVYYRQKKYSKITMGMAASDTEDVVFPNLYTYKGKPLIKSLVDKLSYMDAYRLPLDQEGMYLFLSEEKFTKTWIGKDRKTAEIVEEARELTYKGKELYRDVIRQLSGTGAPYLPLDGSEDLKIFFDVELHPFAEGYFKNKMDMQGKIVSPFKMKKLMDGLPNYLPIATHANEFSVEMGISQKHAGYRVGTAVPHSIGSNVGIKSSTATAQPANQLVISKRNMTRSEGLDNGIDLFKSAIQSVKFYADDHTAYELLAPENGTISTVLTDEHTVLNLKGDSGLTYTHHIKAEEEHLFESVFKNGDMVFLGQTILKPKDAGEERFVSPIASFTWHETEVVIDGNSVIYERALINPSSDVVQLIRFYFMVYLESIYRENKINLDPSHYGAFALQASRFVTVLKGTEEIRTGYLNISKYFNEVKEENPEVTVKMELTKGSDTIMLTAGPVAALAYRDAITVASKSSNLGYLPEFGSLSKVALGVSLTDSLGDADILTEQTNIRKVKVIKLEDEGESTSYDLSQEEEDDVFGTIGDDIFGVPKEDNEVTGSEIFGVPEENVADEISAEDIFGETKEEDRSNTKVQELDTSSIFGGD